MQPTVEERALTQEEISQLRAEYNDVPQSTNTDYCECVAVGKQISSSLLGISRTTHEILGAGFEFLAGEAGKRVSQAEALALLSRPWREVLAELVTYPPSARLLMVTRIEAGSWKKDYEPGGWGKPDELGGAARMAFEVAVSLLEQVIAYPAEQAEEQQKADAEDRHWAQRREQALEADRQQAQWMEDVRQGIRQGRLNGLVAQGALVALGVALGWIAGRKAAH